MINQLSKNNSSQSFIKNRRLNKFYKIRAILINPFLFFVVEQCNTD